MQKRRLGTILILLGALLLAGALVGSLCAWTVWYFWQMYQLRHSM